MSPKLHSTTEAVTLRGIDRLSSPLSRCDDRSEWAVWLPHGTENMSVSEARAHVLEAAELWRVNTHGAFNVAAATVAANLPVTSPPLGAVDHERNTAKCFTQFPVSLDAIA